MKVYAVIDTNVLVSALLAKRPDSAPVQILDRLFSRDFIPMYNEVLRRPKFKVPEEQIAFAVEALLEAGIDSIRVKTDDEVLDPKDVVFYEVAMSRDDSYLVTGNIKHFPAVKRVVTPNELLDILKALDDE